MLGKPSSNLASAQIDCTRVQIHVDHTQIQQGSVLRPLIAHHKTTSSHTKYSNQNHQNSDSQMFESHLLLVHSRSVDGFTMRQLSRHSDSGEGQRGTRSSCSHCELTWLTTTNVHSSEKEIGSRSAPAPTVRGVMVV